MSRMRSLEYVNATVLPITALKKHNRKAGSREADPSGVASLLHPHPADFRSLGRLNSNEFDTPSDQGVAIISSIRLLRSLLAASD